MTVDVSEVGMGMWQVEEHMVRIQHKKLVCSCKKKGCRHVAAVQAFMDDQMKELGEEYGLL